MALIEYKKKRTLKNTPEPTGGKSGAQGLRFVVQKHDASHLHYDFRLEMDGVLKSWAVPKGPSMDPSVKRLAMMVEDHPYDYRTFEGIIPEGNYGAGRVIVWDEGTYTVAKEPFKSKKEEDKELQQQLKSGKIKFTLSGTKLVGEFVLIKAPGRGDKAWLLMKLKDEHATKKDILKDEKSAISGKTLDEIADSKKAGNKTRGAVKTSSLKSSQKSKAETSSRPAMKKPQAKSSEDKASMDKALKHAPIVKFMTQASPMLATLVDKPFDHEGWLYEIKWDGYRALSFMQKGSVELKSRNDKSFNEKFYPIYDALKKWKVNAIVDGEVVVLDKHGVSNFGALQNWRSEADGELMYYVFDILWLDGKDLRKMPLTKRKEILESIMPAIDNIRLSETFDVKGTEFFNTAKHMGLEGIMAKKADSLYSIGERTSDWLKIKANKRQEVVIGGYTNNVDSSKAFSALLVGVYNDDKLIYTGKIGTGFSDKQQKEMLKQFKPFETETVPFSTLPDYNKPSRFNPRPSKASVTWLKPQLICEVSFTEMTADGIMRHPSFEGLRVDKQAKEVTREQAVSAKAIVDEMETEEKETKNNTINNKTKSLPEKTTKNIVTPPPESRRKTFLNPTDETQVRDITGHSIKFTNLSKIYWPDEKITKRDMLNYYYQIAPYILPYLQDRPQSLNRFPNGIEGKSFYQKDVTGKVPDWVERYLYHSDGEESIDKHFMVPKSEADILLMASMGCIELNPWSSRISSPDNPDWCIIDLDPDKNSFDQVIEAARVTKDILDGIKIPSYCKTSGSTGLHIYIPLGAKYTYEESKEFARVIVTYVQREIPKFSSIERATANRKGKIYLDFLQNRPQATLAAPYSLRPKPGATVSMPLHWDEVKKGLKMKDFTIANAVDRVRDVGDLFKPVLGEGISLEKFI
jgi:bifunctional non-homologous end joining protein LigD